MIDVRALRAQQEDPAVGLLESLQAVREKQAPPARNAADASPAAHGDGDRSSLTRLLSSQSTVLIAMGLTFALMVLGVMRLLDRASSPIIPPTPADRSNPVSTSKETDTKPSERSGSDDKATSSERSSPNLSRPAFPRNTPARNAPEPGARAVHGSGHSPRSDENQAAPSTESSSTSSIDLDAEKEKQRQKEEEERLREAGMMDSEGESNSSANGAGNSAEGTQQSPDGEGRTPQSIEPEGGALRADGEITTF